MSDSDSELPKPLPRRQPRTVLTHWAVDSAVVALVLLVPATFMGFDLFGIVVAAMLVGAIAAPWTLRREADELARRPPPEEMIE